MSRRRSSARYVYLALLPVLLLCAPARGQVTIPAGARVGPAPTVAGNGLDGEIYFSATRPDDNGTALAAIATGTPAATFVSTQIDYPNGGPDDLDEPQIGTFLGTDSSSLSGASTMTATDIVFNLKGYLRVTSTGPFMMVLGSDDGSFLRIGGLDVIDNGGRHGFETMTETVSFGAPGLYPIQVVFYQGNGGVGVELTSVGAILGIPNLYHQVADLQVTKTSSGSATPGGTIGYTVTATNAGPDDVTGATVADTFPTGLSGCTWTCSGSGSCTASGSGNINDSAVDLADGQSVTYAITCNVDAGASGTLNNTATVTGPSNTLELDSGNNSATDGQTAVASTNLSITKTGDTTAPDPGGQVVYTVTVTNAGPSDSGGSTVTDTLPTGLTFASSSSGCTSPGAGMVSCAVGALASGESAMRSYTVDVADSAAGDLVNSAMVVPSSGANDPDLSDNTSSHTVTVVPQADLSILKIDDPDPVTAGGTLTYTLEVSNAGPSDSPGATISDTLPSGLTFGSGTGCTGSGTTVTCTVGAIAAGATGSVSFTATVDEDRPSGTVTNTATVTGDEEDPVTGNNSASATTEVIRQADLTMEKSDGGVTSVTAGGPITYTLTVGNLGPNDVTSALVSDTFSGDLDNITWTCTPTPGAFCDLVGSGSINDAMTLPVGGQLVYTINATVESGASGTLLNAALVTPPSGTEDPDLTNNQSVTNTPIVHETDLELAKDDGGVDSVVAGGNLNYLVTVTNLGPSDSGGSSFVDTLPVGTTFITSPSGCTESAGTVTCNVGALRANTRRTLVFAVAVDTAQTLDLVNTATVTADDPDPVTANNTGSHTTPVTASTNLRLLKDASVTTASPGGSFDYVFTIENLGPSDSSGSTLEDILPAGLTFAGGTGCSESGGTVSCTVPALAVDASTTLSFTVDVGPGVLTTILNTATVTANESDPSTGNNMAHHSLAVASEADLALTKDDGVASAAPGEQITLRLDLFNNGPSDVGPGSLEDPLPSQFVFVSSADGCAGLGGTVVCPFGGLTAGAGLSRTFVVRIDPAAVGTVSNSASIVHDITDPVPANDSATHATPLVPRADLALSKDDGGVEAVPGATLDYTLTVSNLGPSDSSGGTISDFLPSGLAFDSSADGCTAGGSTVTCPLGPLAAGESTTLGLTVQVAPTVAAPITNSATVTGNETDPAAGNNTGSVTTPLAALADLALSKDDGVTQAVAGMPLVYTLTVENLGPSASTGGTTTDPLPAGTTFLSSASGCTELMGVVSCPVPPLSLGASSALAFTVMIDPDRTESILNEATVAGVEPDPENSNDTVSHTTPVVAEADLALGKDDFVTSAAPGDEVVWTLTVNNLGPSRSAGSTISDTLPAELIFLSSADGCAHDGAPSGGVATCDVGPIDALASRAVTFLARVDPAATGSIVNGAEVVGDDDDPVLANNTASHTLPLVPSADLSIAKDDGRTVVAPGENLSYTLTVRNLGPSDAPGATVTDTFAAVLTNPTWSCLPSAGASCTASGSGNLSDTVTIPAGGVLVYTVTTKLAANASGLVNNTATVTAPAGVGDPVLANNSSTDTDTLAATADVVIGKTDGVGTAVPGETVTYTLTVNNLGPSDVPDVLVTDTFPTAIDSVAWTCVASAGSTCSAVGSGDITDLALLRAGGALVYTAVATLRSDASGSLSNTATATVPAGITDPTPGNNSATDVDSLLRRADLAITKDDGSESAIPGAPLTYTLVVSNAGPGDAVGAQVVDLLPTALSAISWTCAPGAGASCSATGTGNLLDTVTLAADSSLTYTVTATLDPEATDTVSNTAAVSAPPGVIDPSPSNNSATDTDTLVPSADLAITKTDGVAVVVPGGSLVYTVTVSNTGPSAIADAQVEDSLPAGLDCSWTCVPSAGADCLPGQRVGDLLDLADLPVGATVVYTADCDVAPDAMTLLGGTLLGNTATVAPPAGADDPNPANNNATDTDTLTPRADLSVAKTDGLTEVVVGVGSLEYTLAVANAGPSAVVGATLADPLPPGLDCVWTCAPGAGASCPAGQSTGDLLAGVDLAAGATLVYTATCSVAADAAVLNPGGQLVNTATISVPTGVVDPDPNDNQGSDVDTALIAEVDLRLTKAADRTVAVPGEAVAYTVRVENTGPGIALGVPVGDAMPPELVMVSWSCDADPEASCTAVGIGDVVDMVDLPPGTGVTYTIVGQLPANTPAGSLANIATLTVPAGLVDTQPGNESATVVLPIEPWVELSITKSDGQTTAIPGTALTYSVTLTNAGPSDAVGATITDPLSPVLGGALWSCLPSPFAICTLLGSGDLNDTVTIPAGGTLVYTLTATVADDAIVTLGGTTLLNTATVMPAAGVVDTNLANNEASDADTLVPTADLSLSKTDGLTTIAPGEGLTYTLVVSNAGPSSVFGVTLDDTFSTELACEWSCNADPGAGCSTAAPVAGDVAVLLDLGVGAQVTVSALCTLDPGAQGDPMGTLSNTATLTLPTGSVDPNPTDLVASDTTALVPRADLVATKSDGRNTAAPGEVLSYAIGVSNPYGPSDLAGVTVADNFPTGLDCVWGCQGIFGASCTAGQVPDDLLDVVDLPVGSRVEYTALCTITTQNAGPITNSVTSTVAAGTVDSNPSNNAASDTTVIEPRIDLEITLDDGVIEATPGEDVTFTVVARNPAGPAVSGARVSVPFDPVLDCLWTCQGQSGGGCAGGQHSGPIDDLVVLPAAASVTYTATCAIDPAAANLVGSLLSTLATIELPPGLIDPDPQDNEALHETPLRPRADLRITKSDGLSTIVAGNPLTYTVVVSNPAGPSTISGAEVRDLFPEVLDCTWTCTLSGGASCTAGPVSDDLVDSVMLAPGASLTYSASCQLGLGAAGSLVNTASVTLPAGSDDPLPSNNAASDQTAITAVADLRIQVTDGRTTAVPGETLTYEVIVEHPAPVFGAGPIDEGGSNDRAGTRIVRLDALLRDPGAEPEILGVIPERGCRGSAVDAEDRLWLLCDAGLRGFDPATRSAFEPASPPERLDATRWRLADGEVLRVDEPQDLGETDDGLPFGLETLAQAPSAPTVAGIQVSDVFPTVLDCTWTCTGQAGGICSAGPRSGSIVDSITLPAGAFVVYRASCAIDPAAGGILSNSASLTPPANVYDPDVANNSATDTTLLGAATDLSLTKTDGVTTAAPGSTLVYTLVASNPGPSDVVGARLVDTFPAGLACSTGCTATPGALCPPTPILGDLDAVFTLAAGSSATFEASCLVDPGLLGMLENTATLTAPAEVAELEQSNNTAADLDTVLVPTADLAITLDDGLEQAIPGTPLGYQLVVTNPGPSHLTGATVSTTLPTEVACTWSCVSLSGAVCDPAPPAGDLFETVDLPAGGSVVLTATCALDPAAGPGPLVASAEVVPPAGSVDPAPANNMASDDDTLLVPTADLAISKDDGQGQAAPGGTVVYTITVSNTAGPSQISGALVADSFAPTLSCEWICAPSAGAGCLLGPVSGDLLDTALLPVGGQVVYTATCQIAPGATGTLVNTAHVSTPPGSADPVTGNNTATDIDTLVPMADLVLAKTDGQAQATPGTAATYSITVSNAGPSPIAGAQVSDVPPTIVDCEWTCLGDAGTVCDPGPSAGDLTDLVTLPASAAVVYTGVCLIDPAAAGVLSNTATVTIPAGSIELDPSNNTDDDTSQLVPEADLSITKDDGRATADPGGSVTYTITVDNLGPSDAVTTTVEDVFPPELEDCVWSCAPGPDAVCMAGPVTGDLFDAPELPAGGAVVYTATCQVDPTATGLLTNVAFVDTPMALDPNPGNDSDEDVDTLSLVADLAVMIDDEPDPVAPGGILTWLVTVENQGPLADPAVMLTSLLPADVTVIDTFLGLPPDALFFDGFESGDTGAWSATQGFGGSPPKIGGEGTVGICDLAGGTLTCALGNLAGGDTRSVVIVAMVDTDASGTLIHNAGVAGAGDDPDASNNTVVELTQVAATEESNAEE